MATESMQVNGNGNYAPHHGYGGIDQQHFAANNAYAQQAPPSASTPATTSSAQSDIPKDEVGWYFVEQYYTTLSRTPDKLYLYYNKRSQYVSGNETDKVQVCVGQRAINDRIKELDFQDCKVRITNVDSQASDANIIIQVIGEISNKSQPHRKFTQTFVLATQTNGYFVLNDIFRYIIEEEEEQQAEPAAQNEEEVQQQPAAAAVSGYQEPAPTAEETEPKTLTSSVDPAAVEKDAQAVDKELTSQVPESQRAPAEAPVVAVNGNKADETPAPQAEEAPAAAPAPTAESTAPLEPTEFQVQPEKPKDPEPTPAASPPKQAPPQPAAPPKPAVPKTWASLAAAASKPAAAATPAPQQAQQAPQQQQAKPTMPAKPTPAPSAPAVQAAPAQRDASPATTSGDEWTAVGANHNRTQSRAAAPEPQAQAGRGYIRNVGENIKGPELKEKLSQFGELTHFDVNRQRNCAFIEFSTPSGFSAAVAANPLVLGNDRLYVEERRQQSQRPGQQGGFQSRGGMQGRGGQRGGPGRGAFGGAGRGRGGGAPRGRGGPQAA